MKGCECMRYFIVFQNQSFKEEFRQGILWAPKTDRAGNEAKFHWKSMLLCRPGDVVFSITNNIIRARSIVEAAATDLINPLAGELWTTEGWLVKVNYSFSINEIKISDEFEMIRPLLPEKYSPFNLRNGRGNQGYLFPINNPLGELLDNLVSDTYQKYEESNIMSISLDESEMIHDIYEESGIEEGEIILIEDAPPSISNKPKTKVTRVYGKKTDFIKKAEEDQKTGIKAEILVRDYERSVLINLGRQDLADKVRWMAKEADGYGYDVLSYDEWGNEKYIEVKGTKLMKTTPFNITSNELETSINKGNKYWIYRVYYVNDHSPKFYKFQGRIDSNFDIEPSEYKVYTKCSGD